MTTFLADMKLKGYTQDDVFAILLESGKDKKRREMRLNVTETVDAQRLKEIENLALRVEMAAWRRRNGFDHAEPLIRDGLPLTPEEFTAYMWDEVQELEDAILLTASKRRRKRMRRFVRELEQGRVIMELTDAERDSIKLYLKERAYGASQVTASSACTVKHCTSNSPNPETEPDACV